MSSNLVLRMLCTTGALLLSSAALAAESPMDCIEEIAMPYVTGEIMMSLPTTVSVHVLVGKHGVAQETNYGNAKPVLGLVLDRYFKEKTRYVDACEGKTISFTVRYVVGGNRTAFPVSEVRYRPPDEFLVLCHPVEPALDPFRHLAQPKTPTK